MANSINLGPLNQRKPTSAESTEIRNSLKIGTAGILNATFTTVGSDVRLTLSDPGNSLYSVELSKTRLFDTRANKLIQPRAIYMEDRVIQPTTAEVKTVGGSAFSRQLQTVTVNLPAHGYSTGNLIEIEDINEIDFRGRYPITRVSADQFRYTTTSSGNITSGSGLAKLTRQVAQGSSSTQVSDIYTPTPYMSFDGTDDQVIVGRIRNNAILRKHIASWDASTDTTAETATGITTNQVRPGAITPDRLSDKGPSWSESTGNTSVQGNLEVVGGRLIVDSAKSVVIKSIPGASFTAAGTTITVNNNAHGYNTGDVIYVSGLPEIVFNGGPFSVTRVSANQFRYTVAAGFSNVTGTGTAQVSKEEFSTDGGGRIILSGRGTTDLTDYNSTKSWQIITRDNKNSSVEQGDFEIQSNVTNGIQPTFSSISRAALSTGFEKIDNNTTIKVTTTTAHNFSNNDIVTISGLTGTHADILNGLVKITVINTTQFSYTIPSPGITVALSIAGTASIVKKYAAASDTVTGVGLRITHGSDSTVFVPKLSSREKIIAKSFEPHFPVAENDTANDFEGTAKSARVWTNPRQFTTTGDVVVTFNRVDGDSDETATAAIQTGVILTRMLADADNTDGDASKGITTVKIKDDAVTSDKLANSIEIADTLTVQGSTTTTIDKGIVFKSKKSTAPVDARIGLSNAENLLIQTSASIQFGTSSVTDNVTISNAGKLTTKSDIVVGSGSTLITLTASSGNITAGGTISAAGDVIAYSTSDANLKSDIKRIQNPLEKIKNINGVSFTWNNLQDTYSGYDIGVIAQEVEDVFPEIVTTRENGFKAVRYEKLIPLLIECVKELKTLNDQLVERLENSQ